MSDQELDKLFKDKLENRRFEFSEGAWQQASSMMNASQKAAGALLKKWIIGSLATAASVTATVVLVQTNTGEKKAAPAQEQTTITHERQQEEGAAQHNESTLQPEHFTKELHETIAGGEQVNEAIAEPASPTSGPGSEESLHETVSDEQDQTLKENRVQENSSDTPDQAPEAIAAAQESVEPSGQAANQSPLQDQAASEILAAPGLPETSDAKEIVQSNKTLLEPTEQSASAVEEKADNEPVQPVLALKAASASENADPSEQKNLSQQQDQSIAPIEEAFDNEQIALNIRELPTVPQPSLAVADDDRKSKISWQRKTFRSQKNEWGFMVGLNVSSSYSNTDMKSGFTNSFLAGLRYTRTLHSRWQLSSNLLYLSRKGLSSTRSFESVQYGFGADRIQTEIRSQHAHYLEWPVYITYHLHNRHTIDAGLYASYLLNVSSEVQTLSISSQGETQMDRRDEYGYTSGFKSLDAGLMLGYKFRLTEQIRLGLRANMGLLDVTDNTYFNNNSFDRTMQLRVILDYSLF